jgi:hypothetical protein
VQEMLSILWLLVVEVVVLQAALVVAEVVVVD